MIEPTRLQILLLDDEKGSGLEWKKRLEDLWKSLGLEQNFEAFALSPSDLNEALKGLHSRRSAARENPLDVSDDENRFDLADILFVDYDLFHVSDSEESGSTFDLTGATVAYLARCFSRCGLIVSVNQFEYGRTTFDLTLMGHIETYADYHVAPADIDNANLWRWDSKDKEFRPWYWPVLPDALNRYHQRINQFNNSELLDAKIRDYLSLRDAPSLSTRMLEFLEPIDPTFTDFVKSSKGLRNKDNLWSKDAAARIVAARIAKWLRDVVLPSQSVLVDAPHLISRLPSLAGDVPWEDIPALNDEQMKRTPLADQEKHRFNPDDWLDRPAWWWHKIKDSDEIEAIRDPWNAKAAPVLFLEDTSSFAEKGKEFVAAVDPPFKSRYLAVLEGVSYTPESRLALGRGEVRAKGAADE
jgi:hypothetical protein